MFEVRIKHMSEKTYKRKHIRPNTRQSGLDRSRVRRPVRAGSYTSLHCGPLVISPPGNIQVRYDRCGANGSVKSRLRRWRWRLDEGGTYRMMGFGSRSVRAVVCWGCVSGWLAYLSRLSEPRKTFVSIRRSCNPILSKCFQFPNLEHREQSRSIPSSSCQKVLLNLYLSHPGTTRSPW